MKVGFTGTRKGMSFGQREVVTLFFQTTIVDEFHHGGCVGADYEAGLIANNFNVKVYVHPCNLKAQQAVCSGKYLAVKDPITRNHDIVDVVDILIAAPKSKQEELRSGTWATIRYARKQGKQIILIA